MVFGFFRTKKRIDELKKEIAESFKHVKKDFSKVGDWIKHLDDKHGKHANEIKKINTKLDELADEIYELKEFLSFFGSGQERGLFKQAQTAVGKQTDGGFVQTAVQTAVQTDILANLTVMERAIIWALLNANMKLSYEDIASLLGKEKSTVRGQINTIKQKVPGIIDEIREATGKKRLYIPEEFREKILKSVKVRVKKEKKHRF